MKLLRQVLIIALICVTGDLIHNTLNLPIPGSIIGMIILFICLYLKIIKLEYIKEITDFLLDHLPFFFIPAGVGLISCFSLLKANLIPIISITIISTIITMVSTGTIAQFIVRRKK